MKTAAVILFIATIVFGVVGLMGQAPANSVSILHIGFSNADGSVADTDWTNYFTLTVFVSSNLVDWMKTHPVLEIWNGELTFPLPMDTPNCFCMAMYTPIKQ